MTLKQAQERLEQGSTCKAFVIYSSLDKDDQKTFDGWIVASKTSGWIYRVLVADGHSIGEKSVRKHLEGMCQCGEGTKHKGAYRVA